MFKNKNIKKEKVKGIKSLHSIICFFPYALLRKRVSSNRMLGMSTSLSKLSNNDVYLISYKFDGVSFNIGNKLGNFRNVKIIKPLRIPTIFLNLIVSIFKRIKNTNCKGKISDSFALTSNKLLFFKKIYILLLISGYYSTGVGYIPFFRVKNVMKNVLNSISSQYKILITSYGPLISHEIGILFKKIYGDRIFWVADYRDLIEQNDYSIVKTSHKLRRINTFTFEKADLIVTISKGLKKALINQAISYGVHISEKTIVIYNGFSVNDSNIKCNNYESFEKRLTNDKLIIVYTGTIYHGKQYPSPLLEAVSLLDKECKKHLEIIYAGYNGDIFINTAEKYGIEKLVRSFGLISKSQALKLQGMASILLLLKGTGIENGIITGKFFEYIRLKKPLLVIGDRDIEFNNIANKIGGIEIFGYEEVNKISLFIKKCIAHRSKLEKLFGKIDKDKINRFEWDNLAEKLTKEINLRIKKLH